jgi:hypothetical protein
VVYAELFIAWRLTSEFLAGLFLFNWLKIRGWEPGPVFWPITRGRKLKPRRMAFRAICAVVIRRAKQTGLMNFLDLVMQTVVYSETNVDNYDILCELFKALWFFFIEGLQDRGQSLILNRPV